MLTQMTLARSYLRVDHVDLRRAGDFNCAVGALLFRIARCCKRARAVSARWLRGNLAKS
jgi:hypothetical protein